MKHIDKSDILTIPNLLSLFRLLLIPLILWLYLVQKRYAVTVLVIAVSGASDIVDGWIARRFNMMSDLGKALDPVADKLTQAALVICLVSRYKLMWAVLILFAVKECLMAVWGALAIKRTGKVYGAKWYGKACTVVMYLVMMLLILLPDISAAAANTLIAICIAFMLLSLVMYGSYYRGIFKSIKKQ